MFHSFVSEIQLPVDNDWSIFVLFIPTKNEIGGLRSILIVAYPKLGAKKVELETITQNFVCQHSTTNP